MVKRLNLRFKILLNTILISAIILLFSGCDSLTDSEDEEDKKDDLYVKFYNNPNSDYTIRTIELCPMGVAGDSTTRPAPEWSADILESGSIIAPGDYRFFTLDIPNLHYSQYRLGVDNGEGSEIMLHLQDGYVEDFPPTITHWGGDDRTVSVTVIKNESTGYIEINGWSDWVGID